MWKTKYNGGIKLVNIQLKSETCKEKWLMEMTVDDNRSSNLNVFTKLIEVLREMMYYSCKRHIISSFYKEAFSAMAIKPGERALQILKSGTQNIYKQKMMTRSEEFII